jgi:hypothetical protein
VTENRNKPSLRNSIGQHCWSCEEPSLEAGGQLNNLAGQCSTAEVTTMPGESLEASQALDGRTEIRRQRLVL